MPSVKPILLLISCIGFSVVVQAQQALKLDQPVDFDKMLKKSIEINKANPGVSGFRIQVHAFNTRNEALKVRGKLMAQYPDLGCYIAYKSPTFKIKLGDFINYYDAVPFWVQLKKEFPTAIIVNDMVTPTMQDKP